MEQFGDPVKNERGYPVLPFAAFASIDAQMTTDYAKYADYPHIGIDSIEKDTGRLRGYRTVAEDGVKSGKYVFTKDHIIYSKIRPNLNKVALPTFDGLCSADAYPILPNTEICNKSYLAYVLRSQWFLSYIYPFLSHSLKAQNVMKNVGCLEFSFYNLPRGNSVYYKSRGGEWAV